MGVPRAEVHNMAPQKYYTVDCKNAFAAFDNDGGASSGDEVILMQAPAQRQQNESATGTVERAPKEGGGAVESRPPRREREGGPRERGGRVDGAERAERGFRGSYRSRGVYRGGYGGGGGEGYNRNSQDEEHGDGENSNDVAKEHRAKAIDRGKEIDADRERDFPGYAGRSRGRGRWPARRREFDRHGGVGIGRGRDSKKEGGGRHNWGNAEEDWGGNGAKSPVEDGKAVASSGSGNENDGEEREEKVHSGELNGTGEVAEEEVEKEVVARPKSPEMIDLESYKKMQQAKRAHLPATAPPNQGAKILTEKELEAEGFERYVKEHSGDEGGDEEEEEEEGEGEGEGDGSAQKKKTLNVFEYIHNEGGHVRLFPGHRRGGARGRGRGREGRDSRDGRESPVRRDEMPGDRSGGRGKPPRGKDAPDLCDERAFPKLG